MQSGDSGYSSEAMPTRDVIAEAARNIARHFEYAEQPRIEGAILSLWEQDQAREVMAETTEMLKKAEAVEMDAQWKARVNRLYPNRRNRRAFARSNGTLKPKRR